LGNFIRIRLVEKLRRTKNMAKKKKKTRVKFPKPTKWLVGGLVGVAVGVQALKVLKSI